MSRGKNPVQPLKERITRGTDWIRLSADDREAIRAWRRAQKGLADLRRQLTSRAAITAAAALLAFCLLPSAFCLSDDWKPVASGLTMSPALQTAAYPGPIVTWVRDRCGNLRQVQQQPQRQQQRAPTDPAANRQPQLPSTYQQPAQPAVDLSPYLKRTEAASTYATKAELDALGKAATASVMQHTDVINQLRGQVEGTIKFAEGVGRAAQQGTDDVTSKIEKIGGGLKKANDEIQKLAATPAGQAAEKAAGNWIEQAAGVKGLALAKLALTVGGPLGALGGAAIYLVYRRLRKRLSPSAPAPAGGGASPDPFRRSHQGIRGRARPTAETDGNAAESSAPSSYRSNR